MQLVETCAGGAAVLPCHPPHGEGLAVEGVSLKRQRGKAPVEVLYHSKQHHSSSSVDSQFPTERVHLSSAPGPSGITFNLTLQQLQPDDSGLYSCQLLLRGRSDSSSSTDLGRRVFFVSVQGGSRHSGSWSPGWRRLTGLFVPPLPHSVVVTVTKVLTQLLVSSVTPWECVRTLKGVKSVRFATAAFPFFLCVHATDNSKQ